jgi:hypothetical protein
VTSLAVNTRAKRERIAVPPGARCLPSCSNPTVEMNSVRRSWARISKFVITPRHSAQTRRFPGEYGEKPDIGCGDEVEASAKLQSKIIASSLAP